MAAASSPSTSPPGAPSSKPPLLILHGFPSSSFDFHRVVDRLAAHRRVLLFDLLGYGLSEKPDLAYSFALQADIAMAFVDDLGVDRLGLLTHDVGDTLGGELLARQLEGRWPVEITDRVLTNGSIYFDLTQFSAGQRALLDLPDERLPETTALDQSTVMAGVTATFSPATALDPEEIAAQGEMITHLDGQLLLPRLIRYVEERRTNEARFTGAIERHPSPLGRGVGRGRPHRGAGDDRSAVPGPRRCPAPVAGRRRALSDARGPRPLPRGAVRVGLASAPAEAGPVGRSVGRPRPSDAVGSRQAVAMISPWTATNHPSGDAAHRSQAVANDSRSAGVAR